MHVVPCHASALTQTEGAAEVSPPFVKPTMNLGGSDSGRAQRIVVPMYVRYHCRCATLKISLAERRIDISHETVRFWWNRFGPMFAAEIRKKRAAHMRGLIQWR
jgi:hypothetical protein